MSSTLNVTYVCLIVFALTEAWVFKIWRCDMVMWPSNWEHGTSGPSYDKLTYVCSVKMEPSGNATSLVDIVGPHSYGKTSSDIEVIDIVVSPFDGIASIPFNIGDLLPKLIGVGFYGEQISYLTADDLKQFPNINYLAICETGIVSLDDDLFEYTPNIQALLMPSNKILNVGRNILHKLKSLKFVDFLSNPCLSFYASTSQQLEWLKGNLTLLCPPLATTTITTTTLSSTAPYITTVSSISSSSTITSTNTPSTNTPSTNPPSTNAPSTNPPSTNAPSTNPPSTSAPSTNPPSTNTLPTNSQSTNTPSTTTTSTQTMPITDCEINCPPSEDVDKLKNELIRQGTMIRDLYETLSICREETEQLKEELVNYGALIINLYGIMSDFSYRIFELENINAK